LESLRQLAKAMVIAKISTGLWIRGMVC